MKESNDDMKAEWGGGVFVKVIDNNSKSEVEIRTPENPANSMVLGPNESGVSVDFPIAWASTPNDEIKCVRIILHDLSKKWLLWDDSASNVFIHPDHWQPKSEARPVGGKIKGWGNYRLTISETGSIRMDAI